MELTLDAASSATDANCTSIRAYRAHFDKLRVAAEKALGLFEALDTTSASDVVLAPRIFTQFDPRSGRATSIRSFAVDWRACNRALT